MALVCLGEIVGAHGVKGGVRIRSFAAHAEDVAAYGPLTDEAGSRTFEIEVTGRARGAVLARIRGIGDRNAAEALKGTRLYVERGRLPRTEADEFYHADLIGLEATRPDGAPYGRVVAVHNFGAGDVLEIAPDDGPTFYAPFTADAVPEVDLARGRLVIEEAFVARAAGREREKLVGSEPVEGRAAS